VIRGTPEIRVNFIWDYKRVIAAAELPQALDQAISVDYKSP
jgi:hypothetical protein